MLFLCSEIVCSEKNDIYQITLVMTSTTKSITVIKLNKPFPTIEYPSHFHLSTSCQMWTEQKICRKLHHAVAEIVRTMDQPHQVVRFVTSVTFLSLVRHLKCFRSMAILRGVSLFNLYYHQKALGYTNNMSWPRWHRWPTEAGGLAVYCLNCLYPYVWGGSILLGIWKRRHHFIGYLREEAYFWEEVDGLFLFMSKTIICWRLAGVSCSGSCSTSRAGHLDQLIFLVWPVKCQNIIEVVLVERTWTWTYYTAYNFTPYVNVIFIYIYIYIYIYICIYFIIYHYN